MTLEVRERPSPNHGERRGVSRPDILLVHYTGLPTAAIALERLCHPEFGVSSHYTIDEDGTIYRHVPEERRAWHAGVGCWRGDRDLNSRSIGIELVNPGHEFGYRPFPAPQMAAFRALARDILARHTIAADAVIGHSDIACTRKQDPGELFDWQGLAADGIGLWPQPLPQDETGAEPPAALLARYGYDLEQQPQAAVLTAFQRHFHPEALNHPLNPETLRRLRALLRQAGR